MNIHEWAWIDCKIHLWASCCLDHFWFAERTAKHPCNFQVKLFCKPGPWAPPNSSGSGSCSLIFGLLRLVSFVTCVDIWTAICSAAKVRLAWYTMIYRVIKMIASFHPWISCIPMNHGIGNGKQFVCFRGQECVYHWRDCVRFERLQAGLHEQRIVWMNGTLF